MLDDRPLRRQSRIRPGRLGTPCDPVIVEGSVAGCDGVRRLPDRPVDVTGLLQRDQPCVHAFVAGRSRPRRSSGAAIRTPPSSACRSSFRSPQRTTSSLTSDKALSAATCRSGSPTRSASQPTQPTSLEGSGPSHPYPLPRGPGSGTCPGRSAYHDPRWLPESWTPSDLIVHRSSPRPLHRGYNDPAISTSQDREPNARSTGRPVQSTRCDTT